MLTVDGVEREIIGVMPPGFEYPVGELRATDVWLPYVMPPSELRRGSNWSVSLRLVARLRDGRTLLQAQEQMREITAGLAGTPGWRPETEVVIEDLQSSITGRVRPWMFMLLAAVACVLLVAWVNVANLMLVRAITRARELGIRIALGATRGDLVRFLLTESLLLSVAGALLGILAAWWGVVILKAAMPPYVPRVANIAIDFRVLAVAAVMSLITGVVCSVAAVLHVSRRALVPFFTIRARAANADKGHRWLRSTLVVSQLGLAVVLLVGAGLFASSFARVMGVDLGFDPRNVLVVPVRPMINSLNPKDRARAVELTRGRLLALVDAVANAPGIAVASATGGAVGLPFGGSFSADLIQGDGLPVEIRTAQITPGYFSALGVAILEGRPFRNDDRMGAPRVAILSESAARALFPVGSAIGRLIDAGEPLRVVGVVRDIRNAGPELETSPAMFTALAQGTPTSATLVVRVSQRASTVAPAIMSAIWSEFPDVGLPEPYTLEQSFDRLVAQRRLNMLLVGLFGLLGLTIASVGVYAAMAHLVVQRTREIGIRVALGAAPARVRRSVLRRAAGHVFAGLAIGVTTAWLLAGLVEAFLFRVRAHDLAVYVTAICVLAFAALIAAWIPARRASRVDPIIAIHAD
jgi:predicted permease